MDDIKMDFRKVSWGGMDWTDLLQDRERWRVSCDAVVNFRIP
jgi:hypothetical protein